MVSSDMVSSDMVSSERASMLGGDIPATDRRYPPPFLARAFGAVAATLHAWRARARERTELATMGERERNDLPYARDFDVRREIAKPFWRE